MSRPECFEFAMSFLGGAEAVEVRAYVEKLEASLREMIPYAYEWNDVAPPPSSKTPPNDVLRAEALVGKPGLRWR